ncbi:DUF1816 domain-containing protein [[Limnothrix rosea] IAM M-220]|uniref:DUF1816 domain-containing protein n=1 Tax=[Limnothrix rosea] IAM M-220 TaxID=454133 RepID=UPI000960FA0F|nr:DUF1816 domain-containing protein [[Limnothrix rosea] IAM M-220]OKH17081.1 hypothetical protein NIES208_10850 [[Limnothrix rosea] IAM M-220]
MKELLTTLLDIVGLAYWLEITTEQPECTYYFGPFASREEAVSAQSGYLEDLANEGAENIRVNLKRCSTPKELTIFDDGTVKKNLVPAFS